MKLSALHPRFEAVAQDRVIHELGPRLLDLARADMATPEAGKGDNWSL